ncbi:MAG: Rho termination factor N-terminal domain-containing protein [Cyanobacteriota bacterium]
MNATTFFNAINLAQKPAAIGFLTIIGLGFTTALTTAILALFALLTLILSTATKAAIFGYPLFLAGVIAINIKEQCQKKETPIIAMLPPSQPDDRLIKQTELIENKVLITAPSIETIFHQQLATKQPTWQQQLLKEIRLELPSENPPKAESQDTSQSAEALARPGLDTASHHDGTPFSQLNITIICWQAISQAAVLMDAVKASEMKEIASQLEIPKYRKMNKSQLLVEIVEAFNNAPAFSQ